MFGRRRRQLLARVRMSPAAATTRPEEAAPDVAPAPLLVDSGTATFWNPGAPRMEVLVEADDDGARGGIGARIRALVHARERQPGSGPAPVIAPGTAHPAFLEMLLVELMRAGRFERAFALLAPTCQAEWGDAESFAAANGEGSRLIEAAEVDGVRHLDRWSDPASGREHRDVAELDVMYRVRLGLERVELRRTVHLVRGADGWRSLVSPTLDAVAV